MGSWHASPRPLLLNIKVLLPLQHLFLGRSNLNVLREWSLIVIYGLNSLWRPSSPGALPVLEVLLRRFSGWTFNLHLNTKPNRSLGGCSLLLPLSPLCPSVTKPHHSSLFHLWKMSTSEQLWGCYPASSHRQISP